MRVVSLLLPGILSFASLASAKVKRTDSYSISAASITTIAPETASCANAAFASECRTAAQAAPYVSISFLNFGIHSFGAQAALLALMLYESGSFEYNINHYPGVPGQGTRDMQSPAYNLKYAEWLATVITNSGFSMEEVNAAEAQGPANLLGLLEADMWSFGSAAWFLTTQCDKDIQQGLANMTESGWEAYLTDCVGTTATSDRTAIWSAAIALGHW